MKKSDKKIIILTIVIFYVVCLSLFVLFLYWRNRDALNTFEDVVKSSYVIKEKYGKIEKIRFYNPLNYGTKVNDEYIMKVKITNDKNKTYEIDVIDGKDTNSIVGYIIDNKRYDEYEQFNLDEYKDKIDNKIINNIGEFNNYQELFNEVNKLANDMYGVDNYFAYKIYYDRNNKVYLVEVYSKEKGVNFIIKENGEVLSSCIIR